MIHTERLLLRPWRDGDRALLAAVNADPEVMRFFPAPLQAAESDALVDRFEIELQERGFCPWAVEVSASQSFIGFVGLHDVPAYLPFAPAIEVGWRLSRAHWGHGYALEAARAAVGFGFDTVGTDEIVSMTSAVNERSRRVMERLGMARHPGDDFDHPTIPEDSVLRPHVLYRLGRSAWPTGAP